MKDRYYPGKGCRCYARSEWECCCNVDWTDPEVYELREQVKELKKWKDAVEEQLDISGLNALEPYTDPRKALEHLIGYNFEGGYKLCEERKELKRRDN